jgi:hypothetical protein
MDSDLDPDQAQDPDRYRPWTTIDWDPDPNPAKLYQSVQVQIRISN